MTNQRIILTALAAALLAGCLAGCAPPSRYAIGQEVRLRDTNVRGVVAGYVDGQPARVKLLWNFEVWWPTCGEMTVDENELEPVPSASSATSVTSVVNSE